MCGLQRGEDFKLRRQWSLHFLWSTLTTTKYSLALAQYCHNTVEIQDSFCQLVHFKNAAPPLKETKQILVLLSCFKLVIHNPNQPGLCLPRWHFLVILWVKCCVYRQGTFQSWWEKNINFSDTIFMTWHQSIFYAMLQWSKDNPILINLNDQNQPYHYCVLFAVDSTHFLWDHKV